ncbi:MAG: SDR family NAD(P)-dependent oxidoreductase [Albidovulum sp.]|nr:SDR family NAD(P)-dependent oxidoreductase [Albidovulum sp.]
MGTNLKGKSIVLTGGASGIGLASASEFARQGAFVAIADKNGDAASLAARRINCEGGRAISVACDVADEISVADMVREVLEINRKIDVLFNCAGGGSGNDGAVTDLDLDEFWRVVKVDLFGTLLCCRAIIPHMVDQAGGSIINMSSYRAVEGTARADAYTAAKGGVLSLTRALALQWSRYGIRVNALAPGVVLTERVSEFIGPENPIYKKMLLGPCAPEDVAALALFLASDASLKITGAILPVDSGASAY